MRATIVGTNPSPGPEPHNPMIQMHSSNTWDGSRSSDVPFRSCRKYFHHYRSALAKALKSIKWFRAECSAYNRSRTGQILMTDSKSFWVQDLHFQQCLYSWVSLSRDNLSLYARLSMKGTQFAGISVLWVATGIQKCWKMLVTSETVAVASHVVEAPKNKKSWRYTSWYIADPLAMEHPCN